MSHLHSNSRTSSASHCSDSRTLSYPAECHFRILTEGATTTELALTTLAAKYQVTAPLTFSRYSAGNRYSAYSLSILIQSQEELHLIDAEFKKVSGVRMVL